MQKKVSYLENLKNSREIFLEAINSIKNAESFHIPKMNIEDFDYKLPREMIAQEPFYPRDFSKMMILGKNIEHKHFYDLPDYLAEGDVLVINETKVMPNKLIGKKETGGKVELIITEYSGNIARGILKITNPLLGSKILFGHSTAKIIKTKGELFELSFNKNLETIIQDMGVLPTPSYIRKKLDEDSQYQTVYAIKNGSIAAPTAGLHFTEKILKKIQDKGVLISKLCLHVGYGTFLPVRNLNNHKMHEEYFEIDKENAKIINQRKGRLFVVGTTSVRALEALADKDGKIIPKKGKTGLFIKPGYKLKTKIDALITNFHLPKSSLLLMVSAFIGKEKLLEAYEEAIKKDYRFYSLGDCMLILMENSHPQ